MKFFSAVPAAAAAAVTEQQEKRKEKQTKQKISTATLIWGFSGTLHQGAGKYLISIFHYCDMDFPDGATPRVKRREKGK